VDVTVIRCEVMGVEELVALLPVEMSANTQEIKAGTAKTAPSLRFMMPIRLKMKFVVSCIFLFKLIPQAQGKL